MRNQLRLLRDVSALILIAATWRLWFAASEFPAVPMFSFLTDVPRSIDSFFSAGMVLALLADAVAAVFLISGRIRSSRPVRIARGSDVVFVLTAGTLIALNQHCLQPWLYHFLIMTAVLWLPVSSRKPETPPDRSPDDQSGIGAIDASHLLIIWLTATIYLWSAWSKLDAGFLESHGPKFVRAICDVMGVSTMFWSDGTWRIAAGSLPAGELLVGVALLIPRTRRAGLVAGLAMHLLLFVAVGPWGLNHRAGVVWWNVFFMAQNVILLLSARSHRHLVTSAADGAATESEHHGTASPDIRPRLAIPVLAAAALFPLFRSAGYCDTWTAWAVYASSPARILIQVKDDVADELPNSIQSYVEPRQIQDGWSWLRIDRWSLEATGTPIYPEDRFQFGVARFVAREFDLQNRIRLVHEEESDRWSGQRDQRQVEGEEIHRLAEQFLLNSRPR